MRMNILCYDSPDERNGCMSDHYPARFRVGDAVFSTVAQFVTYCKAVRSGDAATAEQTLKTRSRKKLEELDANIAGLDAKDWRRSRQLATYDGMLAKFLQNRAIREELLDTSDAILACCAKTDLDWCTGLAVDDPNCLDRDKWPGKNLQGYTLMLVREKIRDLFYWRKPNI